MKKTVKKKKARDLSRRKIKEDRKGIKRDSKGRYVKGSAPPNPAGRPKEGYTQLDQLLKSISRVERKHDEKLLDHIVEKAYVDNSVAIAILNRLVPILKAVELRASLDASMDDKTAMNIQKVLKNRFNE